MKRNITIAAVAAAILAAGGYSAFATSGDGRGGADDRSGTAASAAPSATGRHTGHDMGDDHGGNRRSPQSATPAAGGNRTSSDDRPGDDHGGNRTSSDDRPGDDHGGNRTSSDD
ncbi:hypothetical protein ACWCQN_40985 [Streptomyces sp. NPDC001984]|uniref:hypothetical protein n=1 Tax=Streptomyces sp. NPDC002619 TaxID=3364655 RepID=UPI00367B2849